MSNLPKVKEKNAALAAATDSGVALFIEPMDEEFSRELAKDLQSGEIIMPKIKIPSGGGLAFEVPGLNGSDVKKELECVIVYVQSTMEHYTEKYDGNTTPPRCANYGGGDYGVEIATGEVKRCDACPYFQFGSAVNDKGESTDAKACKESRRLFILFQGQAIPYMLKLPVTSIKAYKEYNTAVKGTKRLIHDYITKITLDKDKNAGGISYSKAKFQTGRELTDVEKKAVRALATQLNSVVAKIKETASAE